MLHRARLRLARYLLERTCEHPDNLGVTSWYTEEDEDRNYVRVCGLCGKRLR